MIAHRPSPNHDARPADAAVDLLVLHYTGMETAEAALQRLCDPASRVSAHYTVDEAGTVFVHVPEDRRAWHAGVSFWAGAHNVNGRSIGVEIVNPGHALGYRPFPEPQIISVTRLCLDILRRHAISPTRVVGHSDIAPDRKEDPGELFPWCRLAGEGLGLWPGVGTTPPLGLADSLPPIAAWKGRAAALLARFGYGVPPMVGWSLAQTLAAFQRRFRPGRIDGAVDGETLLILESLTARS